MADVAEANPIARPDTSHRAGPKGHPIFGAALELRKDPLKYFVDAMLTYGDVIWYRIGRDRIVMLNDPRHIKHVVQDNHQNYRKSKFYNLLRPLLGNGIFLSEGKTWLQQRRAAAPSFGKPRFDHLAEQVIGATDDLLDDWRERYAAGQSFNIAFEMMRVTLDAVTRGFLDHRLADEHASVNEALAVVLQETERRVWSVMPLPDRLHALFRPQYRRALKTLDELVQRLIDRRLKEPGDSGDLLTTLIRQGGGRSDPDFRKLLRDQVISVITAGHETTAIALTWVFYLLSKTPAVEQRFHEEIDRVLGGRRPSLADLDRLVYTRAVFEESMRLFPPVWTMSRVAVADDEVGSVKIPAGTTVMLSPYAVHRHPRFWDNPEGFDPERFLPENLGGRPRHAYFPFGGGPRVCLGQRFATMEAQLVLAMIAQSFRVKLVPGQNITPLPMITLRSRGPVLMTLSDRQASGSRAGKQVTEASPEDLRGLAAAV